MILSSKFTSEIISELTKRIEIPFEDISFEFPLQFSWREHGRVLKEKTVLIPE